MESLVWINKSYQTHEGSPNFPTNHSTPWAWGNNARASIPAIGKGRAVDSGQTTQVGHLFFRQQMDAQSFASIQSGGRWKTAWGWGAITRVLVQKVGAGEKERVWRFLKQAEIETGGDIGVFNYLRIQSNFLFFLTTTPTVRLMGVLNKEAERSRLFDCRLVGMSRRRSVFILLLCSTFLCHLAVFIETFSLSLSLFFFCRGINFKVQLYFCR